MHGRAVGAAVIAGLMLAAGLIGWIVSLALAFLPFGWIVEAVIVAVFLAQRSLYDHVAAVVRAFAGGGLAAAREAVSRIVGRDPETLDEAGVCRAAIESNAENYSDGVLAPIFWYAVAGLPGLLIYKLVNTADSMIGHRNARYRSFGWASARLDDLLNLIPARLCGLLIAAAAPVVGGSPKEALAIMLRDARFHRSPNAGWPEAAMAGALGLALAGPRSYGGVVIEDRWMGAGGRIAARPEDISRSLAVTRMAGLLLFGTVCLLTLIRFVW